MQNRVSRPCEYVRLTPILFNHWLKWADEYSTNKSESEHLNKNLGGTITPMGTMIRPPWMKTKFNGLEEFYKYYLELLGA